MTDLWLALAMECLQQAHKYGPTWMGRNSNPHSTLVLRYPVTLVDAINQAAPNDAGRIVVSGSHGGIGAAHYALQIAAALYVFNDAGIGKDRAGIAALSLLGEAGIAACAVSHKSARIGDAADTLHNGVVSAVNDPARRIGLTPGTKLLPFLEMRGS